MKIDAKLKKELIVYFESEGGPLYQLWEDCDIGAFDDLEWDFALTLAQARDPERPIPDLGNIGDHPAIRLYRRIVSAEGI